MRLYCISHNVRCIVKIFINFIFLISIKFCLEILYTSVLLYVCLLLKSAGTWNLFVSLSLKISMTLEICLWRMFGRLYICLFLKSTGTWKLFVPLSQYPWPLKYVFDGCLAVFAFFCYSNMLGLKSCSSLCHINHGTSDIYLTVVCPSVHLSVFQICWHLKFVCPSVTISMTLEIYLWRMFGSLYICLLLKSVGTWNLFVPPSQYPCHMRYIFGFS